MQNKTNKTSSTTNFEERIFYIRLKSSQNQDFNLKNNPHFVKIIKQEYATKYLESLNIEPTQKNINMILKKYPLENCEITAGWNSNAGLYADTITIVTRKKQKKKDKSEIVQETNQKKINQLNSKKQQEQELESIPPEEEQPINELEEEDKKIKFKLSFDIEEIKHNYLFPFNQTFQRRMNINMRNFDKQELPLLGQQQAINDPTYCEHDKFLIFESKVFSFPFIHIEIAPQLLKDLQRPPQITTEDVSKALKMISKLFPKNIFPVRQKKVEKKTTPFSQKDIITIQQQQQTQSMNLQSRYIIFEEDEIESIFQLLQSDEMVKLVGIFVHFSYWLVFGITQPIQIEVLAKKQMYIQMTEIIEYFSSKTKNQKLWMQLFMPMILLTLKMAVEYLMKNHYTVFFEQTIGDTNSPGQVATDKVFYLVERIFDQNNLFCRLTFLESDFKTKTISKGTANDRKFMQKRIFGISPYMDLLMTNPQDGRSRTILAKQHDIDIRDKVLNFSEKLNLQKSSSQPIKKHDKIQQEYASRQKMFNIVLNKMDQDIEATLGKKQMITFKE